MYGGDAKRQTLQNHAPARASNCDARLFAASSFFGDKRKNPNSPKNEKDDVGDSLSHSLQVKSSLWISRYLMPPMPFMKPVSMSMPLPVRTHPNGVCIRTSSPAAADPNPIAAAQIVVTVRPHISRTRRIPNRTVNARRRWRTHHNPGAIVRAATTDESARTK